MYASVIIEYGNKAVDREFTYIIPPKYQDIIKVGHRVLVPFNNREIEGFVLKITKEYHGDFDLKEITNICDEEPILNEEMLLLGDEITKKILCSKISIYQAMLPKALKAKHNTNIGIKNDRYLVLNKSKEEILSYIETCKYQKQVDILKELLANEKILISKTSSSIETLLKKDLVKNIYEEVNRYKSNLTGRYKPVTLNEMQESVVNKVKLNTFKPYLLYGITGSGKTEVYMELIDRVIHQGKTAIMLVPEISLTPQIVDRFVTKFGSDIAILHSGLNEYEKYDEYRKILSGKVKIVVGARSAIFAPLKNIGIIVIDEEHTSTYKQDNNPRYHARDVAMLRGKYHQCPIILGSATPSLESFARALNNVYELLTLTKRAGSGSLPSIEIVDMKEESRSGNFVLSKILIDKIWSRIRKNEQVILLLNRRGYSSFVSCKNCGYTEKCPNCDITLTYHKSSNTLRCHYCGYGTKLNNICPECHEESISTLGVGTEKIEEQLNKIFPDKKVIRMDFDTTSKKGSHEKIINAFSSQEYDILLGTQMVAKGLDFPNVTLVGVINADTSLNIPDFRSSEATFQLLCQVAGRSGRGEKSGKVIIQTFNPEHYAIRYAKNHDYLGFFNQEMQIRHKLGYPPYYYLTSIKILSKSYDEAKSVSNKVAEYLNKNLSNTTILGPSIANVFKVNNVYRFQIILKYKKEDNLYKVLKELLEHYKTNQKVKIDIDFNPIHI